MCRSGGLPLPTADSQRLPAADRCNRCLMRNMHISHRQGAQILEVVCSLLVTRTVGSVVLPQSHCLITPGTWTQ
jgi:hypothetical protein